MPEHDAPEDVSLALLCLSKPILRVGTNGTPREGALTTDRDFEVPLGWTAQERKARHYIEAILGCHHSEFLSVRRDYGRRVYVNLPIFWEEWKVPFSFQAETPPLFAYRGFALNYYGSDDHRWWIALSEHAALCLKALYLEVMKRSRLYLVADNVRRPWRIVGVKGILEVVQSEVTEKIIRLFVYVERIRWRVADRMNRQPPMNPGTFTPVYNNGDWVRFDVTQWAPVVPSSGMIAHALVTESGPVAFQVDRGTRFYGNTRSWPRYGYPECIPAHDDDMRKPGRHGLTHKPMNVAERALRVMLNDAGYYGPLRRLGMAEYPKFEDFVENGFLVYRARPDDVFFQENPGRVKDHWRVVPPAGSSAAEGDGAAPSDIQGRNAGSVPASDVDIAGDPDHDVSQP